MISQIRLHNIRLFDFGLAIALKNIPKTFVAQRCFWTLITASCTSGFRQKEPLGQLVAQAFFELIKRLLETKEEINIQQSVAGSLIGMQELFTVFVQSSDYRAVESSFWYFLDLYANVEQLESELI